MYENLIKFCEDNKLKINEAFNYNRYWDWNISVTESLSILEDDSFNYIKRNHAEALEQACVRWTEVHSNIETDKFDHKEYYKNSLSMNHKETLDNFYLSFKQWQIINGIKILKKEETYFRDWFRGTIDAITNIWIVDYKTSLLENEKYKLQIAFYCRLSWYNKWYILYLSKKKYKFVEVEVEKYMPIVLEIIELSKLLNKNNINQQ